MDPKTSRTKKETAAATVETMNLPRKRRSDISTERNDRACERADALARVVADYFRSGIENATG
jgi:hypothetical protein